MRSNQFNTDLDNLTFATNPSNAFGSLGHYAEYEEEPIHLLPQSAPATR